jgi:hypothetical protein
LNRRRYASPASTRKGACKSRHLHRRQRTCDHSVTWRPRHLAPGDDPTSTATTRSELYSPQCTTAPRSDRRLPQGSGRRDAQHPARHRAARPGRAARRTTKRRDRASRAPSRPT